MPSVIYFSADEVQTDSISADCMLSFIVN